MAKWEEITVYVHGISSEENVEEHSHTYLGLHNAVNEELKKRGKPPLGRPVTVEWGWEKSTGKDKNLAKAEKKVAEATFAALKKGGDFPILFPGRWVVKKTRPLFLYGIADMFYYVSEDGKKTVRKTVFEKVLSELVKSSKAIDPSQDGISVTCIGHSAGTVILHDLLYNIFTRNYTKKKLPPTYGYIKETLLSNIRELAKNDKIRLRKFYTFGSPITPLTCRSNHLIEEVVRNPRQKGGFLKPEDIGIFESPDLTNPRWVNFWDPDDAISYPLEFLYDNAKGFIEDKCIDVSDNPVEAHGKYWTNGKIIKYIAETY